MLGRPVVLSPEGKKVEPEAEKSFVQRYVLSLLFGFGFDLGGGVLTLRGRVGTGGCWPLGRFCCLREGGSRSDRFGGLGGNWCCSFTVSGFIPLVFAAGEMCAVCCACLRCESWGLFPMVVHTHIFRLGQAACTLLEQAAQVAFILFLFQVLLGLPPPGAWAWASPDEFMGFHIRPLSAGCQW